MTDQSVQIDPQVADQLFRQARTVREFADEEVTVDEVAAVYDLIKWGPTAMNVQPLRLLVLRPGENRDRLVPLMAEGNRDRVATAPLAVVVAFDPSFHEYMHHLAPHRADTAAALAQAPQQRESMARSNAYIQAGYLIVGLRAAGLATAPMNGMDFEAVDQEFFADCGWRSLMVVNVARAEGSSTSLPRLPRLDFDTAALVM